MELSRTVKFLLRISLSDIFKYPEVYSSYFSKDVIEEISSCLGNMEPKREAVILYHISKFQDMDYMIEIYDSYLDRIAINCTDPDNPEIELKLFRNELRRLNSGIYIGKEFIWVGILEPKKMDEELEKYIFFSDTIRSHIKEKIGLTEEKIRQKDIKRLHDDVEMILNSCIENLVSITTFITLNEIDISESTIKTIGEKHFPETYQEYVTCMKDKIAASFARILATTRHFGAMLLEGKSDVELLVKFPSVVQDGKPALVKQVISIIINEDKKMGIAIKTWAKKHEKLFHPYPKQEFLDSKFMVKGHEFTQDEKERAFQFIKENKLPRSLYMYKEVCKYLKDEEEYYEEKI